MFTLEVINEPDSTWVKLYFKNDLISLTFNPENPEAIKNLKWEDGCFDTRPCNGEFSLYWKGDVIVMDCDKSGDGNGGALEVSVKSTPELLASLKQAFDQWKALY